ncbi:hypothetical protein CYY_009523 [Polysphondylium violaceum]|uniref:SH3 domain-containing protein n=1 Tax=Polysphondylium violaceum TaxID=133409 RepID=A0A8J4PMP5_9MYCE|nr:hypothetical protein CYY_009523 [Polysphondylium violaceum]
MIESPRLVRRSTLTELSLSPTGRSRSYTQSSPKLLHHAHILECENAASDDEKCIGANTTKWVSVRPQCKRSQLGKFTILPFLFTKSKHLQQQNTDSNRLDLLPHHPLVKGFTPSPSNDFLPMVGESPSTTSIKQKPKFKLDTWKLANPDTTVESCRTIKTSPRSPRSPRQEEQEEKEKEKEQEKIIKSDENINNNLNNINNNQNNQNNQNNNNIKYKSITNINQLSNQSISFIRERKLSLKRSDYPMMKPTTTQYAMVLFDYEADLDEELNLVKDSIIIILEQCQDGWWKGSDLDSKKTGIFPQNYVKLIPHLPTTSALSTSSKANNNEITLSNSLSLSSSTSSSLLSTTLNSSTSTSFKEDPNIFFSTSSAINGTHSITNSSSSSSSSLSSSISNSLSNSFKRVKKQPGIIVHLKVYIPPFNEHTIIQISSNETIKDLLEKLGRKKKTLLHDFKCSIKYLHCTETNQQEPLNLNMPISMINEPEKNPLKLYVDGIDYMTKSYQIYLQTTPQLSNYFYVTNSSAPTNTWLRKDKLWVVFDNQSLKIYKSHNDTQPIRMIGLRCSFLKSPGAHIKKPTFILKTPFQEFRFSHDTPQVTNQWLEVMENCFEYTNNNPNLKIRQKKVLIKSSCESLDMSPVMQFEMEA